MNSNKEQMQQSSALDAYTTIGSRLTSTVLQDNEGSPVVVYRGQHGDHDGLHTRLASISFGSLNAARQYSESPNERGDTVVRSKIFAALLDMRNPFIEADSPFLDLDVVAAKLGGDEVARIALKFSKQIERTNYWSEVAEETGASDVSDLARMAPDRLSELYFDAYHFFDDFDEVAALVRAGYDGAIHHGNAATACELEYKVFDARQVILFAPGTEIPISPSASESLLTITDSTLEPLGHADYTTATSLSDCDPTSVEGNAPRRIRSRP
jgi:hypothetical protein